MFKNISYKIIVATSLLLGLLGPQVASGQEQVLASVKYQPTVTSAAIAVVTSPQQNMSVEIGSQVKDCFSESGLRLDLLLWQSCDFSIQAKTISFQPKVVVKNPDLSDLDIKVATSPNLQNSSNLKQHTSQNKEVILSSTLGDWVKTTIGKYNRVEFQTEFAREFSGYSFNDSGNMVMRC